MSGKMERCLVARRVFKASDPGRFWVLSSADDPFMLQLVVELEELTTAIGPTTQ